MALNPTAISQQIGTLIDSTSDIPLDQAKEQFKTQLTQIIVSAILSASVNPGIIVQVAFPAGSGATTSPGTLS